MAMKRSVTYVRSMIFRSSRGAPSSTSSSSVAPTFSTNDATIARFRSVSLRRVSTLAACFMASALALVAASAIRARISLKFMFMAAAGAVV